MPPSYQQVTTVPEDTIFHATSHLPCVCGPLQGCCRKHNSIRSPNRRLRDHPCVSHRSKQSRASTEFSLRMAETGDLKAEDSLVGLQSSLTLVPIHSIMAYHLSMHHLACIRGQLSPGTKRAFIPELSFEDRCTSERGTDYSWSSEIYFDDGGFLQKQEMHCYQSRGDDNRPESFTACPHQSLTISTPRFAIQNGMVEVSAHITNYPPRCTSHESEKWSNFHGQYAQVVSCTICHSDAECILELHDRSLHIRYTCYKDLGPGVDLQNSKWLAVLTSLGSPQRKGHELDVYERVWNTANSLRRCGLYKVTHQTPKGVFNVGKWSY
ncbi:hypothetical protein CCMA1212_006899 [Trichoderma ghanense]|uniref:Uncharacterized protein n=1 Tax=Trichoderma ghanense TaxID=65468 RepID=A0ABY2GYK3_9HYPO